MKASSDREGMAAKSSRQEGARGMSAASDVLALEKERKALRWALVETKKHLTLIGIALAASGLAQDSMVLVSLRMSFKEVCAILDSIGGDSRKPTA